MNTRLGPLGLTLLFSAVLVAAPIGIDTDTIAIEKSAAHAAKGGNKGGKSSTKRSSRSGGGSSSSSSSSGGGKSAGGTSTGGGNAGGSDTAVARRGGSWSSFSKPSQSFESWSNSGNQKKQFKTADGEDLAHPSELGRLNAWHANENAFLNASLDSVVGLLGLYKEQRTEANEAEASLAEVEQALADALTSLELAELELATALEGEAENIALAEADLGDAEDDAEAAQQAYDDAVAEAIALQQAYEDSKFADDTEEAEALATLTAAIDDLNISDLESDLEEADQAVVDAQVALDEANQPVADAQAAVDDASTSVTVAEEDLAEAETLAASLDEAADGTLEEAANKEVTDEVEFTVNYYLDVSE